MKDGWIKVKPTHWGLSGDDEGKEQFVIQFESVEDGSAGESVTFFGGFTTDKQTEFTIKGLRRCGWQGTDLASAQLSEEPVSILIATETYNGKTRTKVKAIGHANPIKHMDRARALTFAQRMQKQIDELDKKHGFRSVAQQPQYATDIPEDDIPF